MKLFKNMGTDTSYVVTLPISPIFAPTTFAPAKMTTGSAAPGPLRPYRLRLLHYKWHIASPKRTRGRLQGWLLARA